MCFYRRTYIGSMPGRILNALKTVGAKNPVILLDEVDKMVLINLISLDVISVAPNFPSFLSLFSTFLLLSFLNLPEIDIFKSPGPEKETPLINCLPFHRARVFMVTPLLPYWKCWTLNRIGHL